jgi:hypothetical protein
LLNIPNDNRREHFIQGWHALHRAKQLYAETKKRRPDLLFAREALFAFLAAALGAARRPPRILWPRGGARSPP